MPTAATTCTCTPVSGATADPKLRTSERGKEAIRHRMPINTGSSAMRAESLGAGPIRTATMAQIPELKQTVTLITARPYSGSWSRKPQNSRTRELSPSTGPPETSRSTRQRGYLAPRATAGPTAGPGTRQ